MSASHGVRHGRDSHMADFPSHVLTIPRSRPDSTGSGHLCQAAPVVIGPANSLGWSPWCRHPGPGRLEAVRCAERPDGQDTGLACTSPAGIARRPVAPAGPGVAAQRAHAGPDAALVACYHVGGGRLCLGKGWCGVSMRHRRAPVLSAEGGGFAGAPSTLFQVTDPRDPPCQGRGCMARTVTWIGVTAQPFGTRVALAPDH